MNENDISDEHKIKTGMDNIFESFCMQKNEIFYFSKCGKKRDNISDREFQGISYILEYLEGKKISTCFVLMVSEFMPLCGVCLYHWHGNSVEMVWNWVPYLAL